MPPAAPLTFWYAPICPFAHRAWLALELLGLPYDGVVIDLDNKSKEFVDLYPTAVGAAKTPGAPAKVPVIRDGPLLLAESAVITNYLIDAYGGDAAGFLAAPTPTQRALSALLVEQVGGPLIKAFYTLLGAQTPEAQAQAASDFKAAAAAFGVARQGASSGPFFLGAQPSAADLLVFPWAARVPALAAWRGFAVPRDAPEFAPWHEWVAAMTALPAVARTLRDDAFYAKGYEAYATGARK